MRKNEILLVAESDNSGYPSSYLESLFTQSLSVLAARCLCEILKAHPHFNYRNNIIKVLVPYMNRGNKEVALILFNKCQCHRAPLLQYIGNFEWYWQRDVSREL